jgi:hypothetical protein
MRHLMTDVAKEVFEMVELGSALLRRSRYDLPLITGAIDKLEIIY